MSVLIHNYEDVMDKLHIDLPKLLSAKVINQKEQKGEGAAVIVPKLAQVLWRN